MTTELTFEKKLQPNLPVSDIILPTPSLAEPGEMEEKEGAVLKARGEGGGEKGRGTKKNGRLRAG